MGTTEHRNMAWIDLETTGLSAVDDVILEIGVIITTPNLHVVNQQAWVVGHPHINDIIECLHPAVLAMHTNNGLLQEIKSMPKNYYYQLHHIEKIVINFIAGNDAANSPMCGNNIGFDRRFITEHTPDLLNSFHYRNIDVSTLKNVLRLHFPEHLPWKEPPGKKHRSIGDLERSLDEYKYYLSLFGAAIQSSVELCSMCGGVWGDPREAENYQLMTCDNCGQPCSVMNF